MRARLAAVGAAVGLALAGCGDDDSVSSSTATAPTTSTSPQATAPSAPEPPPDATNPAPGATNPGGAEHTGREKDNGGEEAVRSDARFVIVRGRLLPRTISVPAFIALDLRVHNVDPRPHVLVIRADRNYRLAIPSFKAQARRLIPGQRAGTYPVLVDGRRRGAVVFGGEPGP